MKRSLLLLFISAIFLSSCSFLSPSPTPAVILPVSKVILVTPDPHATATPTPFQPVAPTPTFSPTPKPTRVPTKTPSGQAYNPSSPVNPGQRPAGQVNIMILGSDYRPNRGSRTDVIMALSVNKKSGRVTLTSFPRDLYVHIPGLGMERINVAQEFGGFSTLVGTFEYNFGVTPDFYVMTNFNGFKGIIDTLGGVDVKVAQYLSDVCSLPQARNGRCSVSPGTVNMNGATALWYVRSRYSSSDFDRTRRAQEVIIAVFKKIMSLDAVHRMPEIYKQFKSSVETNLGLDDIVSLIPIGSKVISNPSIIERYAIGPAETSNYVVPGTGAWVLLPNSYAVSRIIQDAFFR